jgi:tetratricopeptide (TPR) repeat protein
MKSKSLIWYCILSAVLLSLTACAASKTAPKEQLPQETLSKEKKDTVVVLPKGNPDLAQEAFLRYLYLIHVGEDDLAFEFLRKAQEAEPSNRFLAFTFASALADKKLFHEALMVAEPAKKYPGMANSAEYGLLATLYLRTGKADSAKIYFQKAIQENEEDYMKMYEYSLFLEWMQPVDTKELMRIYAMLIPRLNYMKPMFGRLAQLYLDNNQDSSFLVLLENAFNATKEKEFLLEKINYYESKQMLDSVGSVANRLYKALPTDSSVVLLYISHLLDVQKVQESKTVLNSYIAEQGDFSKTPTILFYKGVTSRLLGELDSAEVYFSAITKDSTVAARAYANLSVIARTKNDSLKAMRYMEQADSLESESFWRDRLVLYMTYKENQKLISYLDVLLEKQKTNFEKQKAEPEKNDSLLKDHPYLALLTFAADIYSGSAYKLIFSKPDSSAILYGNALKSVETYLAIDSTSERMNFLKASLLERLKRYDEAFAAFREILKKNPQDHLVMNFLGYSLIDGNRSEQEVLEGIALVDSALHYEPKNVSYLDSKAWGLYRIGKYQEALKILQEAVALDASFLQEHDYWNHLGQVLEALGDKDMANECFIKLGELEPKHPNAKFPQKKKP